MKQHSSSVLFSFVFCEMTNYISSCCWLKHSISLCHICLEHEQKFMDREHRDKNDLQVKAAFHRLTLRVWSGFLHLACPDESLPHLAAWFQIASEGVAEIPSPYLGMQLLGISAVRFCKDNSVPTLGANFSVDGGYNVIECEFCVWPCVRKQTIKACAWMNVRLHCGGTMGVIMTCVIPGL